MFKLSDQHSTISDLLKWQCGWPKVGYSWSQAIRKQMPQIFSVHSELLLLGQLAHLSAFKRALPSTKDGRRPLCCPRSSSDN